MDDVVIFAETAESMTHILEAVLEYCNLKKLIMNTSKTNVVIFRKGGRNPSNLKFYFENKQVDIVKEYKYLRIVFEKSGLFRECAQQIAIKKNVALFEMLSLMRRTETSTFSTIDKLFHSLAKSVALYGCEVCSISYLDCLTFKGPENHYNGSKLKFET